MLVPLAGGGQETLLSEIGFVLLPLFTTAEACALRLVCREFLAAVSAPVGGQGHGDPRQHCRLARVLSARTMRQCGARLEFVILEPHGPRGGC